MSYADTAKAVAEAVEAYLPATVAELDGKMPAPQALELARASLHKIIDVAADAAQRIGPADITELEHHANGGKLVPRIRSLKPGFWTDSTMVRHSPYARLFYMGSWNFALCEKGHLPDDAFELKLQILPADDVDVEEIVEELIDSGRYERRKSRDGSTYLCITRLPNHNKSDARWATTCQYCNEESTPEPDQTQPGSGETRRDSSESANDAGSHVETQPRKGIGREGKGYICAPDEPAHASDSFTLDEPLVPPTYEIGSDDDPKWRAFWEAYPTKRGKKEARRVYALAVTGTWTEPNSKRKRPKADPDDLIRAATLYAERVRRERTEARHIKQAQGWINAERFRDELDNDLQAEEPGVDIWA